MTDRDIFAILIVVVGVGLGGFMVFMGALSMSPGLATGGAIVMVVTALLSILFVHDRIANPHHYRVRTEKARTIGITAR